MKRITLLCFLTLLHVLVHAQFKTLAESPLFKEPETGHAKLLQLKNGNTAYLHVSNKNGINLTIFSPEHRQIAQKHHTPSFKKLNGGRVNAIFEAGGSITMLISEVDSRQPVLYRLIFDGATGNLEREEKVAEAEQIPVQRRALDP